MRDSSALADLAAELSAASPARRDSAARSRVSHRLATTRVAAVGPESSYARPGGEVPRPRASARCEPGALALATLLVVAGCKTPVGVRETGFEPVYRDLRANVLDEGQPSAASREVLAYLGVLERYQKRPAEVLAELEALNRRERLRNIQAVLAELSYDLALDDDDRGYYLTAAIHAYLYLFGTGFDVPPNPYSAHFALACDVYDRGLARALRQPTGVVAIADASIDTPNGPVAIRSERTGFPWDEQAFSEFLPADAFEVRGLRERVRDGGLGVPLIAVESPGSTPAAALDPEHLGRKVQLPATAFLRLDGGLDDFLDGRLTGVLELYLVSDIRSVDVEGQLVPLTADLTVPLAYGLEGSQIWDFELRGFLNGSTRDLPTGIFLLEPYQRGKIPLVLVHGTASSPATWAQTINGLLADRRLRGHYQIWLALYNTGNPIVYSAGTVRESLRGLRSELDPDESDPALSRMVLVGHSQGGLVVRLLISESGNRIWDALFDTPFDETPMDPGTRELLAQTIFFEPLPFVRRAVFIATPHRGSFVASGWMGRIASRLVELPRDLVELPATMRTRVALPPELRDIPTSVDNMSPGHQFVRTLAELPFAPGVAQHSIVAVKPGQEPFEEGDDGVVAYSSAHLDCVESELVVRHEHRCQGRPEAVLELRRILREHIAPTAAWER